MYVLLCTESVLVTCCTFQKSSEIWLLVIICICHGVAAALPSATRAPTDLELVLSSDEEVGAQLSCDLELRLQTDLHLYLI